MYTTVSFCFVFFFFLLLLFQLHPLDKGILCVMSICDCNGLPIYKIYIIQWHINHPLHKSRGGNCNKTHRGNERNEVERSLAGLVTSLCPRCFSFLSKTTILSIVVFASCINTYISASGFVRQKYLRIQ